MRPSFSHCIQSLPVDHLNWNISLLCNFLDLLPLSSLWNEGKERESNEGKGGESREEKSNKKKRKATPASEKMLKEQEMKEHIIKTERMRLRNEALKKQLVIILYY